MLKFNQNEKLYRSILIPVHRQQQANMVRTFTNLPEKTSADNKAKRPIHFQPPSTGSDPQGPTVQEYFGNSRSTAPENFPPPREHTTVHYRVHKTSLLVLKIHVWFEITGQDTRRITALQDLRSEILPLIRRQLFPLKRLRISIRLQGVTFQKTVSVGQFKLCITLFNFHKKNVIS